MRTEEILSQNDKNNLKIFKHQQNQLHGLQDSTDATSADVEDAIARAEALMRRRLGQKRTSTGNTVGTRLTATPKQAPQATPSRAPQVAPKQAPQVAPRHVSQAAPKSYAELLNEAETALGKETEIAFEDILSPAEIASAFSRVNEIENQFAQVTGIINKKDLSFLFIATALQTVKWILFPPTDIANFGKSFDPNNRLKHNDPSIEEAHKKSLKDYQTRHRNEDGSWSWDMRKDSDHPKTWSEILFTTVPYDRIKGAAAIDGLNLNGNNHRLKTLGHDPVLGWIFGTANILTDTITFTDLSSYRVNKIILNEQVPLPQIFIKTIDYACYDWHCLAAALAAQGAHLASDVYTKRGLPVPVLGVFNPELASKLYNEHYDALCLARDTKTLGIIAASAAVSALINLIIAITHGMFYTPQTDGTSRELYEVRTRKIILISNAIASGSNIIYCYLAKNWNKLDIGGILVTIGRLFADMRFILRIKDEFIQNAVDNDLQREVQRLDNLYAAIIGK